LFDNSEEMLTKEMVLTIVEELEDWGQLEADLNEIGYPYDFGYTCCDDAIQSA
jgi:hypothetical protein